jgi:hypothetical protein
MDWWNEACALVIAKHIHGKTNFSLTSAIFIIHIGKSVNPGVDPNSEVLRLNLCNSVN